LSITEPTLDLNPGREKRFPLSVRHAVVMTMVVVTRMKRMGR